MSHVHIHLHVADLDRSRRFYEALFGAAPVKVKPGYAKFLPALAPLNLALSTGEATRGSTVSHFGVQVDTAAAVREHLARVKASGLPVREEMDVTCCHANQDKFWVRDPDGVEWEVYHLNHDVEEDAPAPAATSACCATTPALTKLGRRP